MDSDASAGIDTTLVLEARISDPILSARIGLALSELFVLGGGYLPYRGFRRQR
jgi:hypothetical protein